MTDWVLDRCRMYKFKPWAAMTSNANIITCDADDVKHILIDKFGNYVKGPKFHERFADLLGNGIFVVDGDLWKQHRKAASHLFATKKLRQFQEIAFQRDALLLSKILTKKAESNAEFDLQALFSALTFDSFCTLAFDNSFDVLRETDATNRRPDFLRAFDDSVSTLNRRFSTPDWLWKLKRALRVGREGVFVADRKLIMSFVNKITRERRQISDEELNERRDLLSAYVVYAKKNNLEQEMLTDAYLADVVLNFILAGRDTTASLLTSLFRVLHHHHAIRDQIEAEIDALTADSSATLDLNTLNAAEFLHATLLETLRLFPPVPVDVKMAREKDTLASNNELLPNEDVTYHIAGIQRNPRNWGDDADKFDPNRWIEKRGPAFANDATMNAYFPAFNAGPRICLGKTMAFAEAKTAVFVLMKHRIRVAVARDDRLDDFKVFMNGPVLQFRGGLPCTASLR
eukprot:CAMPEP_0168588842 /NCGR_PEP_ID=MMETSP0420-20121227/5685_1 /TAXON_ID=498008 /ORGANISM="Pessonella sp." /LENGTH=457 /DNA_ID=CAMNT_0008624331 /DNA_START=183 /DNA_END=1556 /DNA_ORIENTATION=+